MADHLLLPKLESLIQLLDSNWNHIRVHSCGFWENRGWNGPGRTFEFSYLVSGSIRLQQDRHTVDVKQGDLLFVQDTLRNSTCSDGDFQLYYIGFYADKPEIAGAIREMFNQLQLDTKPLQLQGLQQDFRSIMADLSFGRFDSVLVKQHFLHLLVRIYHGIVQAGRSAHERLIHAVINDLHELCRSEHKIKLADVAARYSLNERYLNHRFKQETGVTIGNYITSIRVEHAKRLLETTAMPITTIAIATGFYDGAHFSRTFKSKEGISPQEYRSLQQGISLQ